MYTIYNLLWYLGLPLVLARLWWRGRKLPPYRQRINERLGYYKCDKLKKSIWVHAGSYGEAAAAEPLIKYLLKKYTDRRIVITTMTPTGSARVQQTFADTVTHVYLPYDFYGPVHRFFKHMQPSLGIIMETELWPTLLRASQNIPTLIANARLSPRSVKQYRLIKPLMKKLFQHITCIATQSKKDVDRYIAIGAQKNQIIYTGNLKFDVNPPTELVEKGKQWRNKIGESRPIWIAASTNPGEEIIALDAHKIIRQQYPNALLLLVPRHPDRFKEVTELLVSRQVSFVSRTSGVDASDETEVILGDTMGEMYLMYAASDVALVGGSLTPIGGHNILEPAALNVPVLSGPHVFHAMEAHELFKAADAIRYVDNAASLANSVIELFSDKTVVDKMTTQATGVIKANQRALQKHLDWIDTHMSSATDEINAHQVA